MCDVVGRLGYQMVQQNGFLDVILTRDTSKLRIPVDIDSIKSTAPPMSSAAPLSSAVQQTQSGDSEVNNLEHVS